MKIKITSSKDIVKARTEGKKYAKELGFGMVDQTKIATAISELARNAVNYADGGTVTIKVVDKNAKKGLKIICEDEGPGIPNLEAILKEDVPSSDRLGKGLSGTKRLMDEFTIESEVGKGTTVRVVKWL